MKYKKMIPFVIILFCIFSLMGYQKKFQRKQELLVLESNALLSSQHIFADKTINSTWKQQQKSNDHFNLFAILEQSSDHTIMAFYSTRYETLALPLRHGVAFSTHNSKEVIVGDDIQTTTKGTFEYFTFNRVDYRVIGTFGISKNSPLKKHVLINDDTLIEQATNQLIFDGKDLNTIQWLEGNSMENKGVERWFNIEFFLTLIAFTTWIIIICATFLAAYTMLIARTEIRSIQFQIGLGIKQILKQDILSMSYLYCGLIVLSSLLTTRDTSISASEIITSYSLIYIVLVASYSRLFLSQFFKENTYVLSN